VRTVNLDEMMNQFRIASRELFNHYFRIPEPYINDGWVFEKRFADIEALLFEKLVSEPAALSRAGYRNPQTEILVELRAGSFAPISLNRDVDSGYWDYPVKEVAKDVRLVFISFFDWDQLAYRDNRYVRCRVEDWPTHPAAVGKHALIESQHVRFVKA
jgi:hypothetical protein